jgi:adenosylmethionine-8-amino-7-oxononanoate aminotransferase
MINPLVRGGLPVETGEPEELIERGEGEYLYASDGKRYIDYCSGLWNTPFGYGNPHIQERIREQMERLPFCNLISWTGDLQYEYAKRLCAWLEMGSVLYTCSGSEAIDGAVKAARQYQQMNGSSRRGILAMDLSYHGTTYAAMSASGVDRIEAEPYSPLLPEFYWIKTPEDLYDVSAWLEAVGTCFEAHKNEAAGLILEPVLASGGVIPVPDEAIREIASLCRKYDVLLIDDEVSTGFGRTGTPFIFQRAGIRPDILCLSKAINNGVLPLGALVFSEDLTLLYAKRRASILHFSTQAGNLLSLAAADAVLDLMEDYESYRVAEKGDVFLGKLNEGLSGMEGIDVRGRGLLAGIALPVPADGQNQKLGLLLTRLKNKGIANYYFNNPGYNAGVSFLPPYIATEQQLAAVAERVALQIRRTYGV